MATKRKAEKEEKSFFFKRWMIGLSNVMDRWLFKLDGEETETMGQTFWWVLIAGFLGGGITIAPQLFSDGRELTPAGRIVTIISSSLALILIVWYGYLSIQQLETTKTKILRGVFVFVWGIIGYAFGYMLGAIIVAAVILIFVLWLILKVFGAMVFDSTGSSSSSSSRKSDKEEEEIFVLDDGTEVKETNVWGKYRDVNGWNTYTRDGNTFTKD